MKAQMHAMFASLLTLSACGTLPEERAISGAGIGAATGAIVGAATSLAVAPAAVIGAVGGGLVGAMTREDQINMGEPVWKKGAAQGSRQPAPVAGATAGPLAGTTAAAGPDSVDVANVQSRLHYLGYNPGPVDGIYGKRTENAIRAYQRDHGLDVNGRVSAALVAHMESTPRPGTVGI
jgi:hypothetical protein